MAELAKKEEMLTLKSLPEQIEPRQFCRAWFGLSNLSVEEIVEYETQQGYRKECVSLLSKVTGLSPRTVRSWGKGIKFENMPDCYKLTLAYALKAVMSEKKRVA